MQVAPPENGDNGEEIAFSGDISNQEYCIVAARLRIYHRPRRLGTMDHEPMTVCAKKVKVQFIRARKVTALLREAAQDVLGLHEKNPVIKQWSTHSIQVTATNLLHKMQLTNSYSQKRLRWKSDTFLMYLRNTIHAADGHTKVITVKLSPSDLQAASYRKAEPHEVIVQAGAAAAVA